MGAIPHLTKSVRMDYHAMGTMRACITDQMLYMYDTKLNKGTMIDLTDPSRHMSLKLVMITPASTKEVFENDMPKESLMNVVMRLSYLEARDGEIDPKELIDTIENISVDEISKMAEEIAKQEGNPETTEINKSLE